MSWAAKAKDKVETFPQNVIILSNLSVKDPNVMVVRLLMILQKSHNENFRCISVGMWELNIINYHFKPIYLCSRHKSLPESAAHCAQ